MIETLVLDAQKHTAPDLFMCIDRVMECAATFHQAPLHEKARFAIWTILAQEPGAKDQLALERVLSHLPPNWDAPALVPFREILKEAVR